MIIVSEEYNDAIYAPSRMTRGKVIFQIIDIDAYSDTTPTVTGEASISKKAQIVDTNTELAGKLATFEPDYWKLDGSFVLPPKVTETGYEVGWWSDALSGVDGSFAAPQVITCEFTADHSSVGITVIFDVSTDEYAEDFTIVAYDSSDVVLYTDTVTGNDLSTYILEHTLSNYRKIVVTITKWATGYRRARITEISFGVVYEYTGNELINVKILEEIDTLSKQVTSNEVKFTLDNQDKRFNILNPTGVYPALQTKQKINPFIGVVKASGTTEFVPMGVYYLNEWKSDEGTLTATFMARDILDILAQDDFAGDAYVSKTLYFIAEAVLVAAGVTNYSIDTNLLSITVTATIAKMKYREALQLIAVAGMAVLYSDRATGKLMLTQLSNVASSGIIDFDNVYAPPLIELDVLINTVYTNSGSATYTYVDPLKPASEQTLSATVTNSLIQNSTHANLVGAWIITEYRKRFLYEINWRMNPAFECGDIVTAEDEFGENKTVRITKQEFTFAGYLGGKTNGKGGGA